MGHEPHCFAFYGLEGGRLDYDGYTCWPVASDPWGSDVIGGHLHNSGAEILVTLMDLFVLNPEQYGRIDQPWVAWLPVDSEGIGKVTKRVLQEVDYPVAMSLFGYEQMVNEGVEPSAMIYHCTDTDVFKPLDKVECRAKLGIDQDAEVIGMVMANKGDRKMYPVQLEAVKRYMDNNPDREIKVFIHTDPSPSMGGWDMSALVERIGLEGKVHTVTQYFTSVCPVDTPQMAEIYNCFDVLLNCSAGEGFGIPIIEAQACGVPVIAGSWTAMPELVQNGYKVNSISKFLAGHFGYQFVPDIDDIVYRLECVYRMSDKASAERGRSWVIDNCSVPIIVRAWDSVLTQVKEALDERSPSTAASVS
jgi:glycosyltransferase involved in cell wall biosynthesis